MSSYATFEDDVLRRVFAFTLSGKHQTPSSNPPVIHLHELENELRRETSLPDSVQILLDKDNIERALMSRLTEPPTPYPIWPVPYLIGCYTRSQDESRNATLLKDPTDQQRLIETLTLARQLSVSYIGLILHLGMFPQPRGAEERGPLQLLDALYAACSPSFNSSPSSFSPTTTSTTGTPLIPLEITSQTQIVPLPHSFLEEYANRFKDEGLETVLEPIILSLMQRLSTYSVLGDYFAPLMALEKLISCKPLATEIVRSQYWLPKQGGDGRSVEFQTLLGTAFGISAVPDVYTNVMMGAGTGRQPDVADHCFPTLEEVRQSDFRSAVSGIHAALGQLHSQLHSIIMTLLRTPDCREPTLEWLSSVLSFNYERRKMRANMKKASTDGFMMNYAAVMLKLCEPFLDPGLSKAWNRLDARYVSDPGARGGYSLEDTRLGLTTEEVTSWINNNINNNTNTGGDTTTNNNNNSNNKYHFICETFFMTAAALHLAVSKSLENCQNLHRTAQHYLEDADNMEHSPGMGPMQATMMRRLANKLKGALVCMETSLQQESFLAGVIAYYRLLAAYMIRMASTNSSSSSGSASGSGSGGTVNNTTNTTNSDNGNGALASPSSTTTNNNNNTTTSTTTLPLPTPAPIEFSSLPEFFVEDLCVVLSWVGRAKPELVASQRMEQFMLFFTMFLGSPAYVKNPYLRGKMVEALFSYMPSPDDEYDGFGRGSLSRRPRGGRGAAAEEVAMLFEVHPMVVGHMIRSLIALYVDIERTDRHNAYYEKFSTRYQIGEVMAYLWKLPQHRAAWQRVATEDSKLYIRFVNMMINDSQHLLQEALDTLPSVQETERLQEDSAAWNALPQAEREEREQAIDQHRRILQSDFQLAGIYLQTMQFTSEDAMVAARFFDVQVRDRQARILDFFLRYLTLPTERRRLKLRDPEKYSWRPKELIASLAEIHINLYRANPHEWAQAVAADTDYYGMHPDIFTHLIGILHQVGQVSPDGIADLEKLATAAAAEAAGATAEEENFDDVPEDFEDPLSCRVMSDPVKLPSGTVLDRSTILQHLLTDNRDPFSRAPMSEDDLVDMPELKERIEAWIAEQRAKKKKAKVDGDGDGGEPMQE